MCSPDEDDPIRLDRVRSDDEMLDRERPVGTVLGDLRDLGRGQ